MATVEQSPSPKDLGLVEDKAAAEEAAYAEKPARDFSFEHKNELTTEQRQAVDWFASSQGEEALADFQKGKEKSKDLVYQRVWSFFDIASRTEYSTIKIVKENPIRRDQLADLSRLSKDLVKSEVDRIFTANLYASEKIGLMEKMSKRHMQGIEFARWAQENYKPAYDAVKSLYDSALSSNAVDSNDRSLKESPQHFVLTDMIEKLQGMLAYVVAQAKHFPSTRQNDGQYFRMIIDKLDEIARTPKQPTDYLKNLKARVLDAVAPYLGQFASAEGGFDFKNVMEKNNYLLDEEAKEFRKME